MATPPQERPAAKPPVVFQVGPQQRLKADGYREFYTQSFTFRASAVDFTVVFMSGVSGPGGHIFQQDEGSAVMALPTLKILSEHLSKAVEVIESALGPIKVDQRQRPRDEQMMTLIANLSAAEMKE